MRFYLITGNRRGLGAALTAELKACGQRVSGCSLGGGVDVADFAQVEAWARGILATEGPPDVLINNAGVVTPLKPLWEQEPEDVRRLLQVNVAGSFHVIRAFLPSMIERGSGLVINFSSGWGRTTSPRVAPYCASKWAIEGMTGALSRELPRGLAAVSLDPGTINTEMLQVAMGSGVARHFPAPALWAKVAAPFIMGLGPQHNGQALSVPKVSQAQCH